MLVLASWRWIFRFIAIITFTCGASSWLLLPLQRAIEAEPHIATPWTEKVRRLDLVGVGLIIASLLLLNLGLTSEYRLLRLREEAIIRLVLKYWRLKLFPLTIKMPLSTDGPEPSSSPRSSLECSFYLHSVYGKLSKMYGTPCCR